MGHPGPRKPGTPFTSNRPNLRSHHPSPATLPARYALVMTTTQGNSPVGEAFSWASRIIAVGLVMFLPAVAGGWLDLRLETSFLAAIGLVIGFVAGLAWLVRLAGKKASRE